MKNLLILLLIAIATNVYGYMCPNKIVPNLPCDASPKLDCSECFNSQSMGVGQQMGSPFMGQTYSSMPMSSSSISEYPSMQMPSSMSMSSYPSMPMAQNLPADQQSSMSWSPYMGQTNSYMGQANTYPSWSSSSGSYPYGQNNLLDSKFSSSSWTQGPQTFNGLQSYGHNMQFDPNMQTRYHHSWRTTKNKDKSVIQLQ